MSKGIERVKYLPNNMSLYEWCCEEYEKIKDMYTYISKSNNLKLNVTLIDYNTKKIGFSVDNNTFVVGAIKAFYDYKGWEFPKLKEVIKIKNLKYGECFRFYDRHCSDKYKFICKFICIEDDRAIVKSLDNNTIFVCDSDTEVIHCERNG